MTTFNSQLANNSLPPQNIEAEESIIGGILLDPEAISKVVDFLVSDAFYVKAHQEIYSAALVLHAQGKPTDLMTVTIWMSDRGILDKVGGTAKLAQLLNRTVSAANIDRYAVLVMEKYIRRQLISAGHEIVELGYDTAEELEQVLDRSEQKIFRLTQERPQEGLVPIADTLVQTFNEIESLNQETALPGVPSGFYDLDGMTSGFGRSDLIIVAGRPSMGKCCSYDTEIVLADGSIATIEEIYRSRQAENAMSEVTSPHSPSISAPPNFPAVQRRETTGEVRKVLTLKDDWKFESIEPSAFIDDGIKPVFRLTTRLGRFIETTITHPYLTIQGWRKLSDLNVGDRIAVPRQINIFGQEIISTEKVKLLAYLLGDISVVNDIINFAHFNQQLPEDFIQAVQSVLGIKLEKLTSESIKISQEKNHNLFAIYLNEIGILGISSDTKTIPDIVFKINKIRLALFINRLFAINGWVKVLTSGQSQLGYATLSRKLASQLQHLLLRFGVIANLSKQIIKDKQTQTIAWQLDITEAASIKTFIEEIGIFGQEEAIEAVKKSLTNLTYTNDRDLIPVEIWTQIDIAKENNDWNDLVIKTRTEGDSNLCLNREALSRERLFKLAFALDDLPLQQLANSEVYWDEIVSIEYVGDKQVYDLTIPETHNFVANDICVHNTSFALNIACNIAKKEHLPVAIFSLEMSKEQLAQRLLAGEAKIDSNRLRSGRLASNEFEPLVNAVGSLSELPIFIDDTANLTVMQMRSQLRRLQSKNKEKLGLVLLDYLQLMEGGSDNRVQELSKITRSLKGLAREINVPIIALSQLSRGVEQRTNKRPMMSDLRESGSIEQDADLIIMLYRDSYYNPDSAERNLAEVIITKHRNGPTGTVKLLFQPELTKFENLANFNKY